MSGKEKSDAAFDLDAAIARAQASGGQSGNSGQTMRIRVGTLPADAPEHLRRWHASVLRGKPAIAVVDHELPGGALAQVIRDPASQTPRLLVVSRRTVDDEALLLAQFLLRQSEINRPEVSERRVISVWRDRRYTVEVSGRVETGVFNFTYLRPAGERVEADGLLARAAAIGLTNVPGIGRAALVREQD